MKKTFSNSSSLLAAWLVALLLTMMPPLTMAALRVSPTLHRQLRRQGTANMVVRLVQSNITTQLMSEAAASSSPQQVEAFVTAREQATDAMQLPVLKLLTQTQAESFQPLFVSAKRFWIENVIILQGASASVIDTLHHSSLVESIEEEPVFQLEDLSAADGARALEVVTNASIDDQNWGFERIGVRSVWSKGFKGKGVRVGVIDSGVLSIHTALKNNFDGGCYDAVGGTTMPNDDTGYGTFAAGIIVGGNRIGIAPEATWMSCKACTKLKCPSAAVLTCLQYMLCPTIVYPADSDGHRDCSKRADVVSNSWFGPATDRFFVDTHMILKLNHVYPVYAAGNYGPTCASMSSPARFAGTMAVGSIDQNGQLVAYSSRGPGNNGVVKPDLVAPVFSYSAWNSGINDYRALTGTFVSPAYVAGAVALLLSARRVAMGADLLHDDITAKLVESADKRNAISNPKCGNDTASSSPNNDYGYGIIDIAKAVDKLLASAKGS